MAEAETDFAAVLAEYERQQENQAGASVARFGLAKIASLRKQREDAIEGFTRVLGPEHPDTAASRTAVAHCGG